MENTIYNMGPAYPVAGGYLSRQGKIILLGQPGTGFPHVLT